MIFHLCLRSRMLMYRVFAIVFGLVAMLDPKLLENTAEPVLTRQDCLEALPQPIANVFEEGLKFET